MEARSIRIEAPIPGKPAVGIEIENDRINMVTIREIIDSAEFRKSESKITFAVGKDIAGKAIVADLKSMPHLLIAGSPGSGKSCLLYTSGGKGNRRPYRDCAHKHRHQAGRFV